MTDKVAPLVLYRKYRSSDFNELIGQAHITASLENALKAGRIAHAYLFAGPRGVGKTTAARILARRLNGLKPAEANGHLDIIEIDAASNRRIDEIRDLRDKIQSVPTSAKYKVYIIDEVHMLTTEAFNALLKTLEEPPAHAIFILATTEPAKLPDTIISRTQRFNFRPVDQAVLASHLRKIADLEKIKIDDQAIADIALAASGSVRDGLSLLDQVANLAPGQVVDAAQVSRLLGLVETEALDQLAIAIGTGDVQAIFNLVDQWQVQSVSLHQLCQQLIAYLQQALRQKLQTKPADIGVLNEIELAKLTNLISRLTRLAASLALSWTALEVELIDFCLGLNKISLAPPPKITTTRSAAKPVKADRGIQPKPSTVKYSESGWLKALSLVKTDHNSLYALLRLSTQAYDEANDQLVVSFRFQFHKHRLEEGKNRQILEKALEKVFGWSLPVSVAASGSVQPVANAKPEAAETDREVVDNVLDILGGEVVSTPILNKTKGEYNQTKST